MRAVVLGLVDDDDDDAKDGPERRRRRQRRVVAYDHLVVATGADAADAAMPWKAAGSHAACLATLHGTAAAVAAAAHVVVAGGGYTGVEVAAEIKDAFPAKTVVLVNAGPRLVAGDALAAAVERELARLSVDVRNNVRASVSAPPPRRSGPDPVDVVLSDGSPPLRTDLFLPTTGLVPNARFLPARLPTPAGYVDVDDCMRVCAAPDVWAVGDVVSKPRAGFLITDAQVRASSPLFVPSSPAPRPTVVVSLLRPPASPATSTWCSAARTPASSGAPPSTSSSAPSAAAVEPAASGPSLSPPFSSGPSRAAPWARRGRPSMPTAPCGDVRLRPGSQSGETASFRGVHVEGLDVRFSMPSRYMRMLPDWTGRPESIAPWQYPLRNEHHDAPKPPALPSAVILPFRRRFASASRPAPVLSSSDESPTPRPAREPSAGRRRCP